MVVSSGNYFIEYRLTQTTASKFSICLFYFSPKAILMFYDRIGWGTEATLYSFTPYDLYKVSKGAKIKN